MYIIFCAKLKSNLIHSLNCCFKICRAALKSSKFVVTNRNNFFKVNKLAGNYSRMEYISAKKKSLGSNDTSFKEMKFRERLDIMKEIAQGALPNIISSIGSLLKDAISLYFIGHLDRPLLFAALGFGLTWSNAFATAVIFGFAAGFGTLASQAFGAKNYYKLGLLYQKIFVVCTAILIFICMFLWFTKDQLIAMGFEEDLSREIGVFIRWLVLDFFFCMLFEVNRFYLVAQGAFYVPAYILMITTTLHIFWCHIFINQMGLELIGMSLARTVTDGTSAALIMLYVKLRNPCPQSWFPWTRECLKELGPFTKDIASHGSSVYAEWIAFEISTIIIGFMGNVSMLAAHAATLNYIFLNYTITFGFTLAMSVFVGNAAGEGSVNKAQKYAYIGLAMNYSLVTLLNLVMFFSRESISYFYTGEESVRVYIVTMLTFYIFGMHGDLGCNILAYLLRTLGQDRYVLQCYLVSYYGVGVTASVITGLYTPLGYYGVWASLICGCWIMFSLNAYKFWSLDWNKEVETICNEMKKDMQREKLLINEIEA